MSHPTPSPDDAVHSESFLHLLMRRQFRLSSVCAAAFLLVLLGLPLANYFAPALMATISWFFIQRSIALEDEEVAQVKREKEARQP